MYTYEDLVAALQSGKTVDDIAAQMSRDLNAAKAEVDRQAEETKKAHVLEQKRQAVANVYVALKRYVVAFHPDSVLSQMWAANNGPDEEDLNYLVEQADSLVETFEAMAALTNLLGDDSTLASMFGEAHIPKVTHQNAKPDVDPLENFLNKNVRKNPHN